MRSTKAIINLSNLRHNIQSIKSNLSPNTKICCAVKADCYGHGAVQCAKVLLEEGVEYLAIATVEEGVELRENGISAPLLMLSLCNPSEIPLAVENNIIPFVFDKEYVDLFNSECKKQNKTNYKVHLAVDSGMGRIGCYKEEAGTLAKYINTCGNLILDGMSTHFCVSDCFDSESEEFTQEQLSYFLEAVENVKKEGINPGIRHCANSAGAIVVKDAELDMVRPGIILYGYYAGDFTKKVLKEKGIDLDLKPVMTFETEVCAIRDFEAGKSVGYGRTWKTDKNTKIAVLPVGYADGLLRKYGQAGLKVAINGKNYPVVGRICMDQCMVDLGTDSSVKRWDKAVIFGDSAEGALQSAEEIASSVNTISYEITCAVSKRVERVFK